MFVRKSVGSCEAYWQRTCDRVTDSWPRLCPLGSGLRLRRWEYRDGSVGIVYWDADQVISALMQ